MVKATLYVDEGFVPHPDYQLVGMDDFTQSPEKGDILLSLEPADSKYVSIIQMTANPPPIVSMLFPC